MPTVDEQVQANIRAVTGTTGQWVEDWHALFNLSAIPAGQFTERLIAYYLVLNPGQRDVTAASALNYFLLNPSTVTNGAILSLFAASEQGAWWDPSDFATLFQDSAGTTAVTAVGQPVGRMLDKSGRGNHVIQATAGSRPTLQQDASGRYYLACDGSDDSMATPGNVDFSATNKSTLCFGIRKLSDAATAALMELSVNSTTTAGTFALFAPVVPANTDFSFRSGGTTPGIAATTNGRTAPITAVITGIGDIAAPISRIRVNGTDAASNAGSQGTGNYASQPIYLFRRAGTTLPFNGQFYGGVIRGASSSAAQISMIEAFINAKTGAF